MIPAPPVELVHEGSREARGLFIGDLVGLPERHALESVHDVGDRDISRAAVRAQVAGATVPGSIAGKDLASHTLSQHVNDLVGGKAH